MTERHQHFCKVCNIVTEHYMKRSDDGEVELGLACVLCGLRRIEKALSLKELPAMKRYRVRETYRSKGWYYVMAPDPETAQKLIEDDQGSFKETDCEHVDTDWDTLEELPL